MKNDLLSLSKKGPERKIILLIEAGMNYRVLIIGLGNIGFMYDVKKPRLVHSHAKAVMHSKNFILIGAVEKKIKLRKFFEKNLICLLTVI